MTPPMITNGWSAEGDDKIESEIDKIIAEESKRYDMYISYYKDNEKAVKELKANKARLIGHRDINLACPGRDNSEHVYMFRIVTE